MEHVLDPLQCCKVNAVPVECQTLCAATKSRDAPEDIGHCTNHISVINECNKSKKGGNFPNCNILLVIA